MKNSFYFLHIHKTGGRNYMYNFLNPIKNILEKSNISWLNNEKNGNGHEQWVSEIDDSTFITSIFRDPCKQIVSLYVHTELFNLNNNINKLRFLKYFKDNNGGFVTNFQSKNIVSPTVYNNEDKTTYYNQHITKDEVLNNISKMSLFIKPEILKEINQNTIQNKILLSLGIKNKDIINQQWEEDKYKMYKSKEIYESLSKKEKEYIRSASAIDSEIYETNNLFWKI
jgi:hypothetical protein